LKKIGDRDAARLGAVEARLFLEQLKVKPSTHNAYLIILRAAWSYASIDNPWFAVKPVTVVGGRADPFTEDEVDRILGAFQNSYYLPYVKGLFCTGCRPGEVSALTWQDVKGNDLIINKSWNDRSNTLKSTKTGRDRIIPITPGLTLLLNQLIIERNRSIDLIFPSKQGKYISAKSFLSRHWVPALERAGVRYRSTYRTRHTVWSHAIDRGVSIVAAAEMAGNRPETMTRHYLGSVKRSEIPDLI
jgi:integrase